MGENSAIEWTKHSFNAWIGCTKVSPACDHCYAESLARRFFNTRWGKGEPRRPSSTKNWERPREWNRKAGKAGRRERVFANSLSDVFDAEMSDAWRDDLFELVSETPHLDWMILTKRSKVARDYLSRAGSPLPNLHLGVTVENQKMADLRIPHLLDTPAARRFVSCEPLLDAVYIGRSLPSIDLVIAGGESGPGARRSHPNWFRFLRTHCEVAGTPFMFKQWGDWLPWEPVAEPFWESQNEQTQDSHTLFPADFDADPKWDDGLGFVSEGLPHAAFQRVGKKAAGRLLDGVEHNGRIEA